MRYRKWRETKLGNQQDFCQKSTTDKRKLSFMSWFLLIHKSQSLMNRDWEPFDGKYFITSLTSSSQIELIQIAWIVLRNQKQHFHIKHPINIAVIYSGTVQQSQARNNFFFFFGHGRVCVCGAEIGVKMH